MTSWRRNTNVSFQLLSGSYWNDAISAGDSYLRVHLRWGFQFDCPLENDIQNLSECLVSFGLVTTIGNGSETPPNPRTDGSPDVDPPTQRWIYWETVAPVLEVINEAAGVMVFRGAASTEWTQTKGQVLATGLPAGDSLNLWASWDAPFDWAAASGGNVLVWHSCSILRKV
jgi:hypothetical protein